MCTSGPADPMTKATTFTNTLGYPCLQSEHIKPAPSMYSSLNSFYHTDKTI